MIYCQIAHVIIAIISSPRTEIMVGWLFLVQRPFPKLVGWLIVLGLTAL